MSLGIAIGVLLGVLLSCHQGTAGPYSQLKHDWKELPLSSFTWWLDTLAGSYRTWSSYLLSPSAPTRQLSGGFFKPTALNMELEEIFGQMIVRTVSSHQVAHSMLKILIL